MGDRLIHAYFGVNLNLAWEVAERDVPILCKEIERLLAAGD